MFSTNITRRMFCRQAVKCMWESSRKFWSLCFKIFTFLTIRKWNTRPCDMVGSGFVLLTHNTETDIAKSPWSHLTRYSFTSQGDSVVCCPLRQSAAGKRTWSRLARCGALSLTGRISDYADLILFYVSNIALNSSHFNKTNIIT